MSDDFEKDWLNNDDEDDDSLDWLNAADDEEKLPGTGELNLELDWMRDTGDDKKSTRDDNRLGVTGQLDWLRATQNQGDSSKRTDEDEDFALDWLQDNDGDDDAPKRDPSRTGVTGQLNWREDEQERFEQQIEEAEAAADSGIEDELPEWLQDMNTSDTTAPTMDISEPEDDIPEWLKDADVERPAKAEDDIPEWMQAEDEWLPEDDDASTDEDEEIPLWLQDAETPSPLTTAEVMAISSDQPLDDVPEWLMEADEEHEEESEIPDWLSAEDSEEWEPVDEEEDFAEDDEAIPDVPDWLRADSLEAEEQAIQMEEDAEFDALFGDNLEAIEEEEELESLLGAKASVVPDFDNMFDDTDFESEIEEEQDDFDLLGDLTSQRSGLTGMLGDEINDLDFLMTEDSDSFDLLGELAGDDEEDEFTDTPIADAVAEDEDFLSMAAAQKHYSGSIEDDTLHNVRLDDEFDLDELFGTVNEELPAPINEDDDPFRWFDEDQPAAVNASTEDENLSWLEDIDEEALEEEKPKAAPQKAAASIDDYLASLDDNTFQLPQTGELRSEIDFEALLNDDIFDLAEAVHEEKPQALSPDAPDWLADLSAQTTDEKSAAAIVRQQKDRPLDELNDRLLQLRERGLDFSPTQATEDEDLKRILPGIKEALPEVTFDATEATAIAPSLQLTMDQRKRADLLREIAGSADEQETPEASAKPRRRLPVIERIGLAVFLVLLVALPFFTDALNIGNKPDSLFISGSPERALFDQIDALQPGDYVLIAADYGATGAAELDTATEALLRHALLRGGHPVIVSGNPIGLLRAGALIDTIAEESNLIVNEDYTIGNYLIADVIGLRSFSENIELYVRADTSGESTGLTLDSLDDFAVVVVIAESAERLRGWVEQVAPITTTPLLAITGYRAEPLSEPYLSAESLNGYLVGYEDGYTYGAMLNTLISGGSLDIPPTTEPPPPTATPDVTETPILTETTVPTVAVATEDNTGVIVPAETTLEPTPTRESGDAQAAPSLTPVPTDTLVPSETPLPTDTPLPSATPTPEPRQIAIITVQGAVNVRATPSTSGEVVSALQTDNRADIIGQIENELGELWYNIRFIDPFTGQVAEGWVREDLIQVSLAGTELTPVPSPSPTTEAAEPTPTREGASLKVPPVLKLQDDIEPTPTREGEVAVPEITPEVTAEITPEVTLEVIIPTVTPIPTTEQAVTEFARAIQPMDTEQHDERWYSMTLGLVGAILVIAGGSIINILRVLRRRS